MTSFQANRIFEKMGMKPPNLTPATSEAIQSATLSRRMPEDCDDASSFTESERNVLHPDYLLKCESWLDQQSYSMTLSPAKSDLQKVSLPSTKSDSTPQKVSLQALVPYSPSTSSTLSKQSLPVKQPVVQTQFARRIALQELLNKENKCIQSSLSGNISSKQGKANQDLPESEFVTDSVDMAPVKPPQASPKKHPDQKRYGNTSRVIHIPDNKQERKRKNSSSSEFASELEDGKPMKHPQRPSKTKSDDKIPTKRPLISYKPDDEESDDEDLFLEGSDSEDKEWNPDPVSQSEHEYSDHTSDGSGESASPPRAVGGSNENEVSDDSDSGQVRKLTTREIRAERKFKRNSGQAYVSTSGKNVPARIRKPVHHCKRRQCDLLISEEAADDIFHEYWEQSSYEKMVAYICNRIEYHPIERHRRRDLDSNRGTKSTSYKYYFDVGGVRHNVCKETFLDTLGESDRFLRICAAKKKETVSGIAPSERRRRKPKHAMSSNLRQKVLDHIHSYPAYVSHYSRQQSKQKYLPNTLNLKIMSDQFNAEQDAAGEKKVSYTTYRRIFSTLKLKFKAPASDTCATCDSFKMKIKLSKSEEEKKILQEKHELHLRKADAAYNLKRQFKAKAKEDESIGCIIFDLEQVLPTPSVSTGVAYYLRQLNTYNLTVVDARTNVTHCYMWHEGEAARGANQIASALYHHIKHEVPESVKELHLFSDCCSGQNRNSIVSAMLQVVLSVKPSLKVINHIFLVPGHTRMECDTKHSLIERQKKKTEIINVPQDWYNLVRKTGKGTFKVTEMADKFFDLESLTRKDGPLIMRDKKEDGTKMYWTQTFWFKYTNPGHVEVKSSYNSAVEFHDLNMIRGTMKSRKLKKNWWNVLEKCEPVNKISEEKKKNLLTLMEFIDSAHHEFYRRLLVDVTIQQDTDPDLPSENED